MVETLITLSAGAFIGASLGIFLMALAVAAKREDEELEELSVATKRADEKLGELSDTSTTYSTTYLPHCVDCKHYVRHDKRCGHWNHGVNPLDSCSFWKRRDDEIDGSVPY